MRRFLTIVRKRNIIPKFVSFLLAVTLWAYLSSSGRGGELQFRIALAVENLPGNMAVSSLSDKFVTVIVKGRADLIKDVHSTNIQAVLDLRDPKPGLAHYPVNVIRNEIPDNIEISLRQSSVEVSVEMRISKMIKVFPVITGSVAKDFSMGPIKAKPDAVKVVGPGSILDRLTVIETLPISVAGAEDDFTMDVNLKTEQLDWLEFSLNTVHVVIPVDKDKAFVDFTVPIEIKNSTKYEASLADTKMAVVYMRNQTSLAITDNVNIRAVVYLNPTNVEELMKNKKKVIHNFPINVVYNRDVRDLEVFFVSPEEASVSISVK